MKDEFFTIWVESQEFAEVVPDEDFLNVIVTFSSGESVGLNVWSYQFYLSEMLALQGTELEEEYLLPPDLVVKDMSESAIRRVVARLIMDEKWLQGRGLSQLAPEY